MSEPILVIMAAGMGSRYGGLKQIDPVGSHGELIIDYSIYDALRAGFKKVVFIIKKADELAFKESIGNRIAEVVDVEYAFQELDKLPNGYKVPEDRVKPWGTAHAILCAKELINEPLLLLTQMIIMAQVPLKQFIHFLNQIQQMKLTTMQWLAIL